MIATWFTPSSNIVPLPLVEFRDDVLAEQFDRVHHIFVRNLVRVQEAEQQLAAHRFVPLADLDAPVGTANYAGAAVVEVVHREEVEESRLLALARFSCVLVVAGVLAAALHPLGERRNVVPG